MKRQISVLATLLWFLLISGAQSSTIEGTVDLSGLADSSMGKSRYRKGASKAQKQEINPAAVVYLEKLDGTRFPQQAYTKLAKKAVMVQQDLQFQTTLLPVVVGTTVHFPNEDETFHNVFSYSKGNAFDLGRYGKDDDAKFETFTTPGVVNLFCEVHKHMRSTILVLDTPYFALTNGKGEYRLEGLPEGSYLLKCWIKKSLVLEKKVELKGNKVLKVDFAKK